MVKINVNSKSAKSSKSGGSNANAQTSTVFQRTISNDVKGLRTLLTSSQRDIAEIRKSLDKLVKNPVSTGFGGSNSNDPRGATEENEDNKKQSFTLKVREAITALHKDLMGVLGTKKEEKKEKEDGWFTKLLKKIFSLGNLVRGALAALPFIFGDTLKKLISKGLEKLGVDKELAGKIGKYLTPAIQGAGIGYLLFRNWRGIVAGAVVGVGYAMIEEMVNEWKEKYKDKDRDTQRRIRGLGNLTEDIILGAGIGFGMKGMKGMIAGALVGAVVGSILQLRNQWNDNIKNPEERTTAQHFANLGEGAFYGAITGAVIGGKFGGLKGMFIGLAAGAIVGGAAGLISSMISDFKARHAKSEENIAKSEVIKNLTEGKDLTENERLNKQSDINEIDKKLENDKNLTDEEKIKLRQQRDLLRNELAFDQNFKNLRQNAKVTRMLSPGTGLGTNYAYTSDGKIVDLNASQSMWRDLGDWWYSHTGEGLRMSRGDYLIKKWRGEIPADKTFDQVQEELAEKRKQFLIDRRAKGLADPHFWSSLGLSGDGITVDNEQHQAMLRSAVNNDLVTEDINRRISDSNEKQKKEMLEEYSKKDNFYVNNAIRQTAAVESLASMFEQVYSKNMSVANPITQSINNEFPSSSISSNLDD